jgi:hypothetical protein
MWSRLDDGIISHPKILDAGSRLGKQGVLVALGAFTWGIVYSNHNLTDGELLRAVVAAMPCHHPFAVADELVRVGLWEAQGEHYRIHDFNDWNERAAEVKRKRAADRERKRNPHGIRTESAEIPDDPSRARPRPIPSHPDPIPIPTESHDARARPTPVAARMNPNAAFQGRPNVPAFLHQKFRAKLVGPEDECDQQLRDWYCATADAWSDKPIGDDDVKFWEARFREWVGTTITPANGSRQEPTIAELVERDLKYRDDQARRKGARA